MAVAEAGWRWGVNDVILILARCSVPPSQVIKLDPTEIGIFIVFCQRHEVELEFSLRGKLKLVFEFEFVRVRDVLTERALLRGKHKNSSSSSSSFEFATY